MDYRFEETAESIVEVLSYMDYIEPYSEYNVELITHLFFFMFEDILSPSQIELLSVMDDDNKHKLNKNSEFTIFFNEVFGALNTKEEVALLKVVVKFLEKYERFEILHFMKKRKEVL